VARGDVTCIIGASGSGKSTLLRCINLLERPDEGRVLFHGEDVLRRGFNAPAYRARVGMVFQSFNLFANMNVLENCMAGMVRVQGLAREAARERAMHYLEKVGMAPYIQDRKSTRLNSSHVSISYAVFCLKKKKRKTEKER